MSVTSPLVSVIIPCYNAGRFVEQSVRSIMRQSYTNLEIITIDDCSTDDTLNTLEKLQKEDSRILLLKNKTNIGLVSTLNKGIKASKGKYIARMDADDIAFVERLSTQVKFLQQNANVAMCGGNYIMIDESGNAMNKLKFPSSYENIKAELLFYCPFCHPTVVIRRDVFAAVGLYNEGLVPAEDYELWIRIAEKYAIENLDDFLLYYRWHGGNITVTKKNEQYKALQASVKANLQKFNFSEKFFDYHLKFLAGLWYTSSSSKEINGFRYWKKDLLKKNEETNLINKHVLASVFDKYYSLAMLSILKSKNNGMAVKLLALQKLVFMNPFITVKHFLNKLR